jgi:hypothetical protein
LLPEFDDDVNLLGDNIDTIKENTETLIDVSKEIGLEINIEKTKYMLLSRHQNVGRNRGIKTANRLFENVSQFKYLGTTVTNKNFIQEEIMRRLNSGNAYQKVSMLVFSLIDYTHSGPEDGSSIISETLPTSTHCEGLRAE